MCTLISARFPPNSAFFIVSWIISVASEPVQKNELCDICKFYRVLTIMPLSMSCMKRFLCAFLHITLRETRALWRILEKLILSVLATFLNIGTHFTIHNLLSNSLLCLFYHFRSVYTLVIVLPPTSPMTALNKLYRNSALDDHTCEALSAIIIRTLESCHLGSMLLPTVNTS